MTPPEAPATGPDGSGAAQPPAVSVRLDVLRNRSDFLKAAQARRQSAGSFLLQARRRGPNEVEGEAGGSLIRVGFTCSKKVGNAVARNRAKRRLREIARSVLPGTGRPGWDYVLIGRPGVTADRDFALLLSDLRTALAQVHRKP
ncbi:ribonuclease P protein component [Frigidibacter sp. RF13]|uniref:ribonuclease P protein component n=1 Tax=Frigidibacter sp. RF13 TaxID=2997340 RepID=UPI00226EA858|nr:ribonuclease P protein component [Frigidibacter sp. RF13]MCY1127431.1 ribonuclease P protein component [Frigidibacter sp. RF13]